MPINVYISCSKIVNVLLLHVGTHNEHRNLVTVVYRWLIMKPCFLAFTRFLNMLLNDSGVIHNISSLQYFFKYRNRAEFNT